MANKILIAEDDPTTVGTLEARLTGIGHDLRITRDPDKFAELFQTEKPELVIISLTLNGADGVALCRMIRARPLGALVPIILLGTGQEGIESAQQAIALGADHYFRKPMEFDALIRKVKNYVGEPEALASSTTDFDDSQSMDSGQWASDEWRDLEALLRPDPATTLTMDEPFFDERPPPSILDAITMPPSSQTVDASIHGAQGDWGARPRPKQQMGAAAPSEDSVREDRSRGTLDQEPIDTQVTMERLKLNESFDGVAGIESDGQRDHDAAFEMRAADVKSVPRPAQSRSTPRVLQNLPNTFFGRPIALSQRGIEHILWSVASNRLTCRIEVAASGALRRIFVEDGRPKFCDSSLANEDLAEYLCRQGRIDPQVLKGVRERAALLDTNVEELLIEAGALTADELHSQLKGYLLERLIAFFTIEDGEAAIIQEGPRPLELVELNVPVARLILDGITRKFGRLRLYRIFGTSRLMPMKVDGAAQNVADLLRPEERLVLNAADGRQTVNEIARQTRIPDTDALAILYGLCVLGLIQEPARSGTNELALSEVNTTRALAPRTADQLPGYSDLVRQMYHAILSTDYFQILGIHREANQAEVRAAYEDLAQRFNPHRVGRDSPLFHQVKDISVVLDEAYRLLSNRRLRTRYLNAIS